MSAKRKSYVSQKPNWVGWAYLAAAASFCLFFAFRISKSETIALSGWIMLPALVGIIGILFLLPVRLFSLLLTHIFTKIYLSRMPRETITETAIIIGANEWKNPEFWSAPNYDFDLIYLMHYLKLKNEKFSVYQETNLEKLDEIMKNPVITTIYLVGHGRRHGFSLTKKITVDYCRYNDAKFQKKFVFQLHCNHGGGISLAEYVVPQENWETCLPEHGYMSSLTISSMFIDKIVAHCGHKNLKAKVVTIGYFAVGLLVPIISLTAWGWICWKIIGLNV